MIHIAYLAEDASLTVNATEGGVTVIVRGLCQSVCYIAYMLGALGKSLLLKASRNLLHSRTCRCVNTERHDQRRQLEVPTSPPTAAFSVLAHAHNDFGITSCSLLMSTRWKRPTARDVMIGVKGRRP